MPGFGTLFLLLIQQIIFRYKFHLIAWMHLFHHTVFPNHQGFRGFFCIWLPAYSMICSRLSCFYKVSPVFSQLIGEIIIMPCIWPIRTNQRLKYIVMLYRVMRTNIFRTRRNICKVIHKRRIFSQTILILTPCQRCGKHIVTNRIFKIFPA